MPFAAVIAIAAGLAADAFAVSVSCGCANPGLSWRRSFLPALFFGFFQALMPVLGWFAGNFLLSYVASFSHFLSFGMLCAVGGKMIYESLKGGEEGCREAGEYFRLPVLLMLAVATSLDALAAGFTFAHMGVGVLFPALISGVITFVLSAAGVHAGCRLGPLFGRHAETAGGIVLILIGAGILIEPML